MNTNSKRLVGKVAILIGASKGIGAAIAKTLDVEGADVVVNHSSRREDADRVVAVNTGDDGRAIGVQANVSERSDINHLFAESKKAFRQLDILVNNAGVLEMAPLESVTEEHFYKHFDLNVLGVLLTWQEALKYFSPAGGSIIDTSSVVSTKSMAGASVYSATKATVDALTRSLAKELGSRHIRVNSVNPGMVETEGARSAGITENNRKQTTAATTAGPHSTTARHRASGRIPRFIGRLLDHRREHIVTENKLVKE